MTIRRFGSILVATSLVAGACGGDESGTEPSGTDPAANPTAHLVAVPARLASTADPAPAGTGVTDAFHLYLRPLLGSGMPNEYRLQTSNRVPKLGRHG